MLYYPGMTLEIYYYTREYTYLPNDLVYIYRNGGSLLANHLVYGYIINIQIYFEEGCIE